MVTIDRPVSLRLGQLTAWPAVLPGSCCLRMTATPAPPDGVTAPASAEAGAPLTFADAFLADDDTSVAPEAPDLGRHRVTAVVVAHDGARWLPTVLHGLDTQTRPADVVVTVDTGSTDATPVLLAEHAAATGASTLTVERSTGFGAAVAAGAASAASVAGAAAPAGAAADAEAESRTEWLWLLHDDSHPAPDALERLLTAATEEPSIGVVGPKLRGWRHSRDLREVGVTITGSGRRVTGLEHREQDQGQHDGRRDVLAVSTAGMLVRRDVWERLGGLDPALRLFRDDVDLGWRARLAGVRVVCETSAVVHHAEAAASGRRRIAADSERRHLLDRRNAIYVVLANVPSIALPLVLLRVVVSSLLRAAGLLLAKLPADAADELRALLAALGRPDRVLRARRARRATRTVPAREVRHLLASPRAQARHALEAFAGVVAGGVGAAPAGDLALRGVDAGPVDDAAESLPSSSTGVLGRFLRRPTVIATLLLAVVALLAGRRLVGRGRLLGGSLLPAPAGGSDLWRTYTESWHSVGLGSAAPAPPWTAVMAGISALLGGRAPLAVDVVVLLCVPLAGLTAGLALGRAVQSRAVRVWACAAYALLPVATGAVAGGRLGAAVTLVCLPLVARAVVASASGSTRAAWAGGIVLTLPSAFVPRLWLVVAVAVLASSPLLVRSSATALRLAALLLTPLLLLMPWILVLRREPWRLLAEPGFQVPGLAPATLRPAAVALLHPGGAGMYPVWWSAGVLAVGLAALLVSRRRRLALGAWVVALSGLAAALLLMGARTTPLTGGPTLPVWVGPEAALLGLGVVLAAALAADSARTALRHAAFGWRQPVALTLAVMAGAAPLLAGVWWVRAGADGPVQRRDPVLLPAYVAAEGTSGLRPRTLVVQVRSTDALGYTLLGSSGPRLGDADTAPAASSSRRLDSLVADLTSGRGGDAAVQLAAYDVRYVLVERPVPPQLAGTLDAIPGLARLSAQDGSGLWKLVTAGARLRLEGSGATPLLLASAADGPTTARLPDGVTGRRLVLSERADPGWRATLDGRVLTRVTVDGWAQGWAVPADGGVLNLEHSDPARARWIAAQGVLLLLVVVLALPGARTREEPGDDFAQPGPPRGVPEPDVRGAPGGWVPEHPIVRVRG